MSILKIVNKMSIKPHFLDLEIHFCPFASISEIRIYFTDLADLILQIYPEYYI